MKKEIEQRLLDSLNETLLLKFPAPYFSIGHIMDGGMSLLRDKNVWHIVVSDRGNVTVVGSHANLLDACSDYIEQLTMGEDSQELKDIFVTKLFEAKPNEDSADDLIEM